MEKRLPRTLQILQMQSLANKRRLELESKLAEVKRHCEVLEVLYKQACAEEDKACARYEIEKAIKEYTR